MQLKNNNIFLFSALFIFFLSNAACNLVKVAANENSAANPQEAVVSNSNAVDLPASEPTEKKLPEFTARTIAGTYRYKTYKPNKGGYDHTLEVEDKGNGKLHVTLTGSNVWTVDGAETMHEASGEGDAQLNGNIATARIIADGDDRPCRVNLAFTTNQVKVSPAKNCNFNVALDGLYTREKAKRSSDISKTKSNAAPTSNLRQINYSQLRDFVNDIQKNKPGHRFIITEVPANKISKIERYELSDRQGKNLYYLQIDDSDSDVSTMLVADSSLIKSLNTNGEIEPTALRVTAVLVEFAGEFDFYRSSFVTKIEGLDNDDKVIWTATGSEPVKVKFRQ